MQIVWSRSLRPQSTCRCILCANSPVGILSRRTTTTGIARKQLTSGDAFALLLGPVLGAAYVADAKAKNKRREEWDAKIAAVKAQVEQIRRDGVRPCNIRNRNLRRLPALSRSYSSATKAAAVTLEPEDDGDPVGALEEPAAPQPWVSNPKSGSTPAIQYDQRDRIATSIDSLKKPELSDEAMMKCRRRQRLIAIKLAIRMILHTRIGKSPRYITLPSDYIYDEATLPQSAEDLIRHLQDISKVLSAMDPEELRSAWGPYQSLTRGKIYALDKDMSGMARRFRRGEISVTQLVEEFAEKLLSSSKSPTVRGYISFLSALSRARFDELSFMIDGTMIESQLPYDKHSVFILLWQHGKNKDARCLDRLIKKLTTGSAEARFGEQWVWRNIKGVVVPMPPSQDPQILQILIYAALKCNQPHRAEAWSKVLSWTDNGHRWFSHVIRNFLKYYSAHRNWHRGLAWLKIALDQSESLATQGLRHLQRVAFSMLEMSVSYKRRRLYQNVMTAACECCLGIYSADADLSMTQRSRDILDEWESCHEKVYDPEIDGLEPVEKARMFVRKLQYIRDSAHSGTSDTSQANNLVALEEANQPRPFLTLAAKGLQENPEGNRNQVNEQISVSSNASRQDRSVDQWKELCRQQQKQLEVLLRQVDSLKSLRKPDVSFVQHGHGTRPAAVMKRITPTSKSTDSSVSSHEQAKTSEKRTWS